MRTTAVILLVLAAGCAAKTPDGDDDSTTGGPDAGSEACASPGATRCTGSEYQTCESGTWTTTESCTGAETCYAAHGCAECDPTSVQVCVGNDVYSCTGGVLGGMVQSCGAMMCQGGSCGGDPNNGCAEETQVIYVVDKANELLSFEPRHDANTFHLIGHLDCHAGAPYPEVAGLGSAVPFSMSVDRQGRAWVLYTSGEIFLVDTANASCQPTGYVKGSAGFQLFGMSFVADTAGSDAETLYVSGGVASLYGTFPSGSAHLGKVNPTTFATSALGAIVPAANQRIPDLTGTGNGDLWGYFPTSGLFAKGAIARLDKATGARLQTYDLPADNGIVDAWAFAHYGGRYYIFVNTTANRVLRLDPMAQGGMGQVDEIVPDSPYQIVGAGVSTCAPVVVN